MSPVDLIETIAGGQLNATEGGSAVLNASVTIEKAGQRAEISVGVPEDWPAGTYHWIHVATVENGTEMVSNSGGIQLAEGVKLNLTPNTTTIRKGNAVAFTLNRSDSGAPVNGTLTIGDRTVPVTNGIATVNFDSLGNYTVTASKDTTDDAEFINDSVTIHVLSRASLNVTNASVTETQAYTGEQVDVEVNVTNSGGFAGNRTLNLTINNSTGTHVLATREVEVPAHSTKTFFLNTSFETVGDKALKVNGVDAGTVTIDPAVTVTDFTINKSLVTVGEPLNITATVTNHANNDDSVPVTLVVDGTDVRNTTPEV
ncbi:MAG: hypothetical protein ABEI52_00910, partial [Halobacteriaceae archaeon]